jgi:tellurite resistance protein TerC
LMERFIYLRTGLAFVLGFVGIKMILADYFHLPTGISLVVIVVILAITITASVIVTRKRAAAINRK